MRQILFINLTEISPNKLANIRIMNVDFSIIQYDSKEVYLKQTARVQSLFNHFKFELIPRVLDDWTLDYLWYEMFIIWPSARNRMDTIRLHAKFCHNPGESTKLLIWSFPKFLTKYYTVILSARRVIGWHLITRAITYPHREKSSCGKFGDYGPLVIVFPRYFPVTKLRRKKIKAGVGQVPANSILLEPMLLPVHYRPTYIHCRSHSTLKYLFEINTTVHRASQPRI